MKNDVMVLWSGGVESTMVVLHYLTQRRRVLPVFVDYGQDSVVNEQTAIESMRSVIVSRGWGLVEPIEKVKLSFGAQQHPLMIGASKTRLAGWSWFLPGRNLTMLSLAGTLAAFKDVRTLALGVNQPPRQLRYTPYPDSNRQFLAMAQDAIQMAIGYTKDKKTLHVEAPAMDYTKTEALQTIVLWEWQKSGMGKDVQKKPGPLSSRLWSCYKGGERPCAVCKRCEERNLAWYEVFGVDEAHMVLPLPI